MGVELGRLYEDGEEIVRQGDQGDCMYVIQSGSVSVSHDSGGGQMRVGELGRGDLFGEMALFEKEVRSATVTAVGEVRVMRIDKRTFLGRVEEDPTLAFRLVRRMSQNIRELSSKLASVAHHRSGPGG